MKESVGEWLPAVHAFSRLAVSSRRNCAITCRIVSLKQVQHVWRHCVAKWFETSYYHKQAGLSGHVPKQAFSGGWMSAWLETGWVENWTCSVILPPGGWWDQLGGGKEGVNEQQWQIGFLIGVLVREGLG